MNVTMSLAILADRGIRPRAVDSRLSLVEPLDVEARFCHA